MLEINMGAGSSIVILELIFQSIFQSLQIKRSRRVNDIQAFSTELEGGFVWDGQLRWHDSVYVIHHQRFANCHVITVVAFHPKEPDPIKIWVCCRVIWPGGDYGQSHQLKKPEQVLVGFSKRFGP